MNFQVSLQTGIATVLFVSGKVLQRRRRHSFGHFDERHRFLEMPFTVSNLKLDDVFSDVLCKFSRSIIKQILEHPAETFDVTPFVGKRCKHPIEEIQAAIDEVICSGQATKLKICLDFIEEQEKHISELDSEIFRLAKPYKSVLDFIRIVPGLSKEPLPAIRIVLPKNSCRTDCHSCFSAYLGT